jgi:hypothetical protein
LASVANAYFFYRAIREIRLRDYTEKTGLPPLQDVTESFPDEEKKETGAKTVPLYED